VAAFGTLARSGRQPGGALVAPRCSRCRPAEESSVTAGFTRVGARAALDSAARTGVVGMHFYGRVHDEQRPTQPIGHGVWRLSH
jgi:hypothetical protein